MYGGVQRKVGYKPFFRMGTPSRPYRYSPFYQLQGGINTEKPSHEISDSEVSDAYNCEYSTVGLKTRAGKAKYNSTEISGATSVRGLHMSYATGSGFMLIGDDQGKVYKDNGSGTFTEIQSGLNVSSRYMFEDWKTYTFWVTEQDSLTRYDGSNVDTIAGAPTSMAGIVNAEGRLFGWDFDNNYIYFCDLNDETTWSYTTEYSGLLTVPAIKGDKLVRVVRQGRTLVVFKNNSIWRYYIIGLPRNWSRTLISDSLGCAGKYAVDVIQDVIFFMGNDGRMYQLTDTIKLISQKVESPDTSRWGIPTDVNLANLSDTTVKFLQPKRVIRVIYDDVSSTSSVPNKYADYDITAERWTRGNLNAYCMTVRDGKDDNGYMYVGDTGTGYVYRIDTGTADDGVAIDAYFKTKDYNFGIVDIAKILCTAYVSSKPTGSWNVTVTESRDFDPTGTNHTISQAGGSALWDTAVWDTDVWGGQGLIRSRIDTGNNKAYYVSYKFGNSTLNQYFEIRGLGIKYQVEPII